MKYVLSILLIGSLMCLSDLQAMDGTNHQRKNALTQNQILSYLGRRLSSRAERVTKADFPSEPHKSGSLTPANTPDEKRVRFYDPQSLVKEAAYRLEAWLARQEKDRLEALQAEQFEEWKRVLEGAY